MTGGAGLVAVALVLLVRGSGAQNLTGPCVQDVDQNVTISNVLEPIA